MNDNLVEQAKFDNELFDDYGLISAGEQIFSDNPIGTFQSNCLESVLYLCGWKKKNLAHLLQVSDSTVNNILANGSMTNDKPTYLSRAQFVLLLDTIQTIKVEQERKVLVVLFLFSWLCSGLRTETNFDNYEKLYPLESSDLDRTLFFRNIDSLCPDLLHSFNLFMKWRFEKPEVSMSEFYGGGKDEDCWQQWFDSQPRDSEEAAIKKAEKNVLQFIPKYREWYILRSQGGIDLC